MSAYLAWCAGVVAATVATVAVMETVARTRSASFRHALWTAALVPCLAGPVLLAIVLAAVRAAPPAAVDPLAPSWTTAPTNGLSLLALAWLAPALILVLRSVTGWALAARIAARGRPVASGDWLADARASARALGLRRAPALVVSDEVPGPAVVGALRPVLLVPTAVLGAQHAFRRAVLDHELAHVARRDVLVSRICAVATALNWYNPPVWWAARRMDLAAECACDDAVLRSGMSAREYANVLVSAMGSPTGPAVVGAGFRAAPIVERVRALAVARARQAPVGRERWLLGAALMVALIPLCAGAALASRAHPRERVIRLEAGTRFTVDGADAAGGLRVKAAAPLR